MKGSRASLRYAKATLSYAEKNGSVKDVAKDMNNLVKIFTDNNMLNDVLKNPLSAVEKKQKILNTLLPNASKTSKKLLNLLSANNRLQLLFEIAKNYLKLFAESQGEVKVFVTSAVPLTSKIENLILEKSKKFSNKNIFIENQIDPTIIGGFILKINDIQYDASILNKLRVLKTKLLKTNTV